MSTGRLFHALGAATENARSDETSLERGTTRSCLPAERREARPGMLATGVTNSVRYDGARPLTAWCTKRQSLNLILSAIEVRTSPVSRVHVVPNHEPIEQQR